MFAKFFNFFVLYLLILIVLYLLGTFLTWQPNPSKWWIFENSNALIGRFFILMAAIISFVIKKGIDFQILIEKDEKDYDIF